MAVDTAARRCRALGVSVPGIRPTPDGTISAEDWAALVRLYYSAAVDDVPGDVTLSISAPRLLLSHSAADVVLSIDAPTVHLSIQAPSLELT